MRSLIVATVLLAVAANGFVDFAGMSGAPKKYTHPVTGNIHYEHDVHHVFSEHGTFYKARYKAEHEAHWHFVQLHEHIEGMQGVHCGFGEDGEIDHLIIKNPSTTLLEQVHKQKTTGYSHTVITAAAQHQCGEKGKGIFRRLQTVQEQEDGSLILVCKAISYSHVFKNLDLKIETNHVHMKDASAPELIGPAPKNQAVPQDAMSMKRHFLQHEMSTQGWFHHFTHAVSHACSHVVHDVSHVAHDAVNDVKKAATTVAHTAVKVAKTAVKVVKTAGEAVYDVGKLALTGKFDVDHTFNLPGVNWNKDVTKTFSQWDMTVQETIHLSASFDFHPSVVFSLQIEHYHVENLEVYFNGDANAGVTGSFSIEIMKVIGGSKVITDIKLHDITFSIGPVPVWLKPSIPIYAGFDIAFDADFTVSAVISASSTVKWGYAYSPSTGTRHINEHDFTFKHDIGPMDYTIDIGLGVYVMPVVACTVESVGEVQVGARLQADATIESNNECLFALYINAQPTITLTAAVNLHLLHHDIYQHEFGPFTLWTKKIPLYNYCKPQKQSVQKFLQGWQGSWDSSGAFARHMEQQSQGGRVVTTVQKKLGANHVGAAWSGSSKSIQDGQIVSMDYSAQFSTPTNATANSNTSLLFFALSKTMKSPHQTGEMEGKLSTTATLVYRCDELPAVGKIMNYTLVPSMTNSTYNAASNSSVLNITASPFILWKLNAENIRFVEMEAPMVFGTVALVAPAANNNSASFNIFKNGGGVLEVDGVSVNKTDVIVIIVYAAVATLAMVLAGILACFFFRKFKTARRTVIQAEESSKDGLVANEESA